MAKRRNTHGLSRHIPKRVKEEVRRQCKFSCIFCGSLIYQYDHFDPEFVDCKSHEPEGIALLCPEHHEKKKKKRLGNDLIAEQRRNPFGLSSGFGHTTLDWMPGPISVRVGSQLFEDVETVLEADGTRLLWIEPPLSAGEPYRISGDVYDRAGSPVITLRQNELVASTDRWDIKHESNRLVISDPDGEVALNLVHEYPSCFRLDRFHMNFRGVTIAVSGGDMLLMNQDKSERISMGHNTMRGAPVAISIT